MLNCMKFSNKRSISRWLSERATWEKETKTKQTTTNIHKYNVVLSKINFPQDAPSIPPDSSGLPMALQCVMIVIVSYIKTCLGTQFHFWSGIHQALLVNQCGWVGSYTESHRGMWVSLDGGVEHSRIMENISTEMKTKQRGSASSNCGANRRRC